MELNEKKIKIMEVAEKLFAEHGFSGTSVREIAKRADVNVAMISYYFDSKDKLLESIFLYRGDYLQSKIEDLLQDESLSSWKKLEWVTDEYVRKFISNQHLHRIISRENGMIHNGYIRNFIIQRRHQHYMILRGFVEQGQEKGEMKAGVDTLMLYTTLQSLTQHLVLNADFMQTVIFSETKRDPSFQELQDRTQQYLKVSMRAILQVDTIQMEK
ncbi:TetR family transcriptional regulator [Echinicola pacifica]|uniref:TetR family transcriptional regulator n=1 Tax=Echinicola pacifica TaxID=346377 RepID=A0A918PPP5_9BACT|nr:TetR family transcriptional regulator [Echinicola pacifica]GGZ18347.1 TetR family transcriptional regulator [Echinicola pacifica]